MAIRLNFMSHKTFQCWCSLLHDVHHEIGDSLIAQQSGTNQHMIFISTGFLALLKVKGEATAGQQWSSIVAKIFGNSTNGGCMANIHASYKSVLVVMVNNKCKSYPKHSRKMGQREHGRNAFHSRPLLRLSHKLRRIYHHIAST